MSDTAVVDPLVERHLAEAEEKQQMIATLQRAAFESGRDLNADEEEAITKAQERLGAINRQLDLMTRSAGVTREVRDRLATYQPVSGRMTAPDVPKYRTAGELLFDTLHAEFGSSHDPGDREARTRYGLVMQRAAQHMGTTAEATTPTAGGLAGLVVTPVVGPVISFHPSTRPFLTGIGVQPAPNAITFVRPRIIDPDFATGAGVQPLQKAELASKKFDIGIDTLNLVTVGGYLNVSQQLLSLQAGSLDIIVNQLTKRVNYQAESAAIAELAKSTAEVTLADDATAAEVITALWDAAALVVETTLEPPTWLAFGPRGWAKLGGVTDTAGRPLFPWLGATNAIGSMTVDGSVMVGPLGLRPILTPGITNTDLWMGNSYALEAYEYRFGVLEAVEPSVLGRQVAVAEALALYRPTTKEATTGGSPTPAEGNGAVRIGP